MLSPLLICSGSNVIGDCNQNMNWDDEITGVRQCVRSDSVIDASSVRRLLERAFFGSHSEPVPARRKQVDVFPAATHELNTECLVSRRSSLKELGGVELTHGGHGGCRPWRHAPGKSLLVAGVLANEPQSFCARRQRQRDGKS
jgi:hypothetical protein